MRKPAPLCSLKELKDGTYYIEDLADMHEAMDEQEEYEARWNDVMEAQQQEK